MRTTNLRPASIVAEELGVSRQMLNYYYSRGKLTIQRVGRIVLMDPVITQQELDQMGFFTEKPTNYPWNKKVHKKS